MSYHLDPLKDGGMDLYRMEGRMFELLAFRLEKTWKLYYPQPPREKLYDSDKAKEITEEEAAMILFGCKESA